MYDDLDLKIACKESNSLTYLELSGRLTEKNGIPSLFSYKPVVVINTSGITHTNSCGLADWEDWINNIKGTIFFIECSRSIIEQANLSQRILGQGTVVSLFIPMVCPDCESEEECLVENVDNDPNKMIPKKSCQSCGAVMEPDISPSLYFAFLEYSHQNKLDVKMREAIQELRKR